MSHLKNLKPYVGIDQQVRHIQFDSGFGDNLFHKNYLQSNLFAGIKFNEFFGVEVGYEWTYRRTRSARVPEGEILLGQLVPRGLNDTVNSFKIEGFHISLLGDFQVPKHDKLHFTVRVGLARLKSNLIFRPIGVSGIEVDEDGDEFPFAQINSDAEIAENSLSFTSKKVVLRVGAGIQYNLTQHVTIRGTIDWENTAKFDQLVAIKSSPLRAGLKNSINYGIGLSWLF